jgi:redox-sensitive bicupin YhaK (pirin superfamily)
MVYSKPRYDTLINMDPSNYEWLPDASNPGVAYKRLGSFTERQFEVAFVRLDKGASLAVEPRKAPQVLFVTKGAVTCGGQKGSVETAFTLDPDEGPVKMEASEDSELYFLQLPMFAAGAPSGRVKA